MYSVFLSSYYRQDKILYKKAYKMLQVFLNIVKLIRVLKERGNWKLIKHSRKQLNGFIFCRSGMNRMPLIYIFLYWYGLLKGPEVLIWRLETFGFLFLPETSHKAKKYLNSYL
jgi:hypothetical protein